MYSQQVIEQDKKIQGEPRGSATTQVQEEEQLEEEEVDNFQLPISNGIFLLLSSHHQTTAIADAMFPIWGSTLFNYASVPQFSPATCNAKKS